MKLNLPLIFLLVSFVVTVNYLVENEMYFPKTEVKGSYGSNY